ncbi:MAG: hypothetical protein ACPGID_10875 [Rubricella sp.]
MFDLIQRHVRRETLETLTDLLGLAAIVALIGSAMIAPGLV